MASEASRYLRERQRNLERMFDELGDLIEVVEAVEGGYWEAREELPEAIARVRRWDDRCADVAAAVLRASTPDAVPTSDGLFLEDDQ